MQDSRQRLQQPRLSIRLILCSFLPGSTGLTGGRGGTATLPASSLFLQGDPVAQRETFRWTQLGD